MNKIVLTTGLTVATLFVSAAAMAKPGAYIGANMGMGGMDTQDVDINVGAGGVTAYSEKLRGFAGSIDAGYLFNQGQFDFGPELGYSNYANNTYSSTAAAQNELKYSGHSIDLLGVVQYNFTSNWNMFGKAGLAYVSQDTDFTTAGVKTSKTNHKIQPKLAIGGGYLFDMGLGLNVAISHTFGQQPQAYSTSMTSLTDDYTKVASVTMFTIGASYTFG